MMDQIPFFMGQKNQENRERSDIFSKGDTMKTELVFKFEKNPQDLVKYLRKIVNSK